MIPSVRSDTQTIFRVGRSPDCWTIPKSTSVGNGRFDDPRREYRVLYCASSPLGCFLETLAVFRRDLNLMAELSAIDGIDDYQPLGEVPIEWFENRALGSAHLNGRFVDVSRASSIGWVRRGLRELLLSSGFPDFDVSSLCQAKDRHLTQAISRLVFDSSFSGLCYISRFGADVENWASFEPSLLEDSQSESLSLVDPDLLEACRIHGLRISPNRSDPSTVGSLKTIVS